MGIVNVFIVFFFCWAQVVSSSGGRVLRWSLMLKNLKQKAAVRNESFFNVRLQECSIYQLFLCLYYSEDVTTI